jgi:hypothetical protein
MQTFEKAKDSLLILRIDADAVIADSKNPVSTPALGRDMHFWRPVRAAVLDRVADQVLKQLLQMRGVHRKRRQRIRNDPRAGFLNRTGQVG